MSVLLVLVSILFKSQFHIYFPRMCLIPSILIFFLFCSRLKAGSGLIPPPPPLPPIRSMGQCGVKKVKYFCSQGRELVFSF